MDERAGVALALVILGCAVSLSGGLARVDHAVFDAALRMAVPSGSPPPGVVIVAVDQRSLQQLGRWPWPRRTHADLLRQICRAQPKAIAMDIAFAEAGEDDTANQSLALALRSCGKVVLPVVLESTRVGGQVLESAPIPVLAQAAAGLGRVSVRLDDDGVARGVDLWEGVGTPVWPLLAQTLLQVGGLQAKFTAPAWRSTASPSPDHVNPYALARQQPQLLRFAGPPGTVASLSAVDVLRADAPTAALRDQLVLVGATAAGLGDLLPTPVSSQAAPMPGVEVLANVVLNLRDGLLITPLDLAWAVGVTALLSLMPLLWWGRFMPLPSLVISAVWFGLLLLASMALPVWGKVWLAPSGAMVAALTVYPLWSWRRLEAARRHLDRELGRLAQAHPSAHPLRRLGFEQRLSFVQRAQERFHDLQKQREETLAFLSHDIRAPLASAVQQLELGALDLQGQQRLQQQLARAQALAQDFLAVARANALDRELLNEIDLGAVLHQAVDAVFELARAQSVQLQREIPDEPVWIHGDFGLLERVADNLLRNALHFAPPGSTVTLRLTGSATQVEFSVCDQGPGVAPGMQAHLFEKFSAHGSQISHDHSTGLGLYFVRTVALRHGGEVGYVPLQPSGACFWVRLAQL